MTINWGILITFIVIGLIVLLTIFFLLFNVVPRPPKREKNTKKMLVTNDTNSPTNISVDEKTFTIPPNQSIQMVLRYGTEVTSPKGNYQINKGDMKQLIIGSYGLHSDLNATPNTRIVNLTDKDVQLSYTSDKGSENIIVPSRSRVRGPTIFKGQRWNVSGADTDPLISSMKNQTLPDLIISSLPKRIIVWNGKMLK